jgi:hypothetical protein
MSLTRETVSPTKGSERLSAEEANVTDERNYITYPVTGRQLAKKSLNFGDVVRSADTIGVAQQPQVGDEAAIPIRSYADIKL